MEGKVLMSQKQINRYVVIQKSPILSWPLSFTAIFYFMDIFGRNYEKLDESNSRLFVSTLLKL